eukprot:3624446-Alexandrium_andersonii.AAC.1
MLRPDGGAKHRIVWGLGRPLVNGHVHQGERVVAARLADVVEDAADLLREIGPGQVSFSGAECGHP